MFLNNNVKMVSSKDNFFKYLVKDNQEYTVNLLFSKDDKDECEDAQCQCDSFIKSGLNCIHIRAALIFCKAKNNYEILKSEILKAIEIVFSLDEDYKNFLENNNDELKPYFYNFSPFKISDVENNDKSLLKYKEEQYLDTKKFYELINIYYQVLQSFTNIGTTLYKLNDIFEKSKKSKIYIDLEKLVDEFYLKLSQLDYLESDYSKEHRLISNNIEKRNVEIKNLNTSSNLIKNSNNDLIKKEKNTVENKNHVSFFKQIIHIIIVIFSSLSKALFWLISFILGLSEVINGNEKTNKNERLEKEMKWNNFDDYEKEEVRNGNYDVYNFEDPRDAELDEDDYYYDDRK